jgi:hypothetical protein
MESKRARIVKPENKLKKKIGMDMNIHEILKPDVIKGAQAMINEKTESFLGWSKEDIAMLETHYKTLQASPEPLPEINRAVKKLVEQLRDRCGTFNYQLGSQVAKSLLRYMEVERVEHKKFVVVAGKHIESLQTIFAYNLTGDGGTQGKELMVSLRKLVKMYSDQG